MRPWFSSTPENKTLSPKWAQDCPQNGHEQSEAVPKMGTGRPQNGHEQRPFRPLTVPKMGTSLSTIPYAQQRQRGAAAAEGWQ